MVSFTSVILGGGAGILALVGYRRFKESRKRLPDGSHVVIVGAGYGGISLADKLDGKGKFTLIDSRNALHHNMASLRAVVEPGFTNKTFVPYKPRFEENFIQGKVVGIDTANNTVSIAGESEPIPYTHLVIATGSSGPFPGKCDINESVPNLVKKYDDYAQTIKKAEKVVIVGGGAVGVELAAEIAHEYPGKSVTVIHNSDTLVSKKLVPKALDGIDERLEKLKVNVIKGDTVSNLDKLPHNILTENLTVETSGGRKLEADLVVPCVGLRINSGAYATSLPDKMAKNGSLMVNDTLQVKGLDNVYAIGDCNDLPVGKLAMESAFQAHHVWETLASGSDPKPYKENTFRMVVPLGREGGVVQNGTWVMGDWLAKRIKSSNVFVDMAWSMAKLPVPKK